MIAHLIGRVHSYTLDSIILDVGGVGYLVHVPMGTLGRIKEDGEGRVSLFVHTSVREDAIQLFGFSASEVKRLFTKLIGVSGVGPKMALAVLSELSPGDFVMAVHTNNVTQLTKVSGVGKKTAQRLILELKNSLDDIDLGDLSPPQATVIPGVSDDLRSALLNLGYAPAMVDATVVQILAQDEASAPIEVLLRQALKLLR
ncbi:MAG: Holliday junction branch migration protein RuvA [Bradymonadaceae bacterium]|nr:Holliday junction branch migration protein RuvA [Lujinxingiaceae bacterium]